MNSSIFIDDCSVFTVVGAQVCSLPDTGVYSAAFLNSALSKTSQSTIDLLVRIDPANGWDSEPGTEDFIQYANEAVSLLVSWLADKITPEALKPCLDLLELQLSYADHYEYPLMVSMLQLMTCLAEQRSVASQLTADMIKRWMDVSNRQVRSTNRQDVLSRVALLLRTMIKIKNVPLLIEVYR